MTPCEPLTKCVVPEQRVTTLAGARTLMSSVRHGAIATTSAIRARQYSTSNTRALRRPSSSNEGGVEYVDDVCIRRSCDNLLVRQGNRIKGGAPQSARPTTWPLHRSFLPLSFIGTILSHIDYTLIEHEHAQKKWRN
jgi:hypothetical protein